MEEHTVYDSSQQKDLQEAVRQLSWFRAGFFFLLLILIISLMGNAYLFYYMSQVDQRAEQRGITTDTDNGLRPPDMDSENPEIPSPSAGPTAMLPPDQETREFVSEVYNFSFMYPADWEVRQGSQQFETGDVIMMYKYGPTQQGETEVYDGVSIAFMKPVETDKALDVWMKETYNTTGIPREGEPAELSSEKIGDVTYQKAYVCGLGCFTYYHHKIGNKIYGFVTFVEGPTEEAFSQQLRQTIESITYPQQ